MADELRLILSQRLGQLRAANVEEVLAGVAAFIADVAAIEGVTVHLTVTIDPDA